MLLGTVFFSGLGWLLPAILLLLAGLALLVWSYSRVPVSGSIRGACFILKLIGLIALALCLLEPLWSGQRATPGANQFILLADNSQHMRIKDRGQLESRGQKLQALLGQDKSGWQSKMEENFQLRRYLFDSRLTSTHDFGDLVFDGRSTSLGTVLKTIAERYKGEPLAGVLVFTDGNATDLSDGLPDLTGLPPIYPVVSGSDDPITDVAIDKVAVNQTSFEDSPVTVQSDVRAVGYGGAALTAQLIEVGHSSNGPPKIKPIESTANFEGNKAPASAPKVEAKPSLTKQGQKIVSEQSQTAPKDGDTSSFRFLVRPEGTGISFYRLRVAAKDEMGAFDAPQTSKEATLENNSRILVADSAKDAHRILYVSGRPSWEFKFLHRAVEEDDQIDLVGLIRIASREKKFEFKGRAGEESNPLFRGFDRKTEETERYDKPVLRRVNVKDESELRDGFPQTAEELFGYDAIMLADVEAEYFTRDQLTLLQRFVSERGGGLLMMGGPDAFAQGQYQHTPIDAMLPVYLDHQSSGEVPEKFKLSLTREGWLQPWARLRNNQNEDQTRLEGMPPFMTLNQVGNAKPGASVIATVTDEKGKQYPALVVQRFGNGRTGALMVGDFWRWGLLDEAHHRDMDKAWRQMLRWLVTDVPGRIALQAQPKARDENQAVLLQVRVRDKEFKPMDNANVILNVRTVVTEKGISGSATNTIRIPAEESTAEAGLYEAVYVPHESGGYLAEAVVTDAAGAEVGKVEAGWATEFAADEFRSLTPNRALLESIAKKTGGQIVAATKLASFAEEQPKRSAPVMENWSEPLWHRPAVFLFALICFAGEWGLRRWKGLA